MISRARGRRSLVGLGAADKAFDPTLFVPNSFSPSSRWPRSRPVFKPIATKRRNVDLWSWWHRVLGEASVMRSNGMTADRLRAAKGVATYHANYTKLYTIDLSLRHRPETVSYTPQMVGE